MPLFKHDILPDQTEIGIWKIEESAQWFEDNIVLYQSERAELESLSPRKQLEWLAARYLLHQMSGRAIRGACLKDNYGKPYLQESGFFISISHSHELTAIVASPKLCGIDIQIETDKLARIAQKFVSEGEADQVGMGGNSLESLHWIWGAKEAMYKAYGMRKLAFKQNLSSSWKSGEAKGIGLIQKEELRLSFELNREKVGAYYLVLAFLKATTTIDL
ncbi:MAG: 4'-phosphopantetheinyl transferase superfamily protein [Saprospiraceae bacterium]